MALEQVLRHLGQVVTAGGKMLRVTGLGARPGIADVKIRDMPVLKQTPEFGKNTKLAKLPQPLDGQHARVFQLERFALFLGAFLPVYGFVGDRRALPPGKINKMPGPAVAAASVMKNFALDDRPAILLRDT